MESSRACMFKDLGGKRSVKPVLTALYCCAVPIGRSAVRSFFLTTATRCRRHCRR